MRKAPTGEPSLWTAAVLCDLGRQRDFFFAGSGREPNKASSNSTSSLEAIWIIRRISFSLRFVRQQEVSGGSCDLVSGVFQACFKDQPGRRLLSSHRRRLGFSLDRRLRKLDNLPAPSLVPEFRESPDQPQQLYFFGHGRPPRTQRMSRCKGSHIDPERKLKGADVWRSSAVWPADFRKRDCCRQQPASVVWHDPVFGAWAEAVLYTSRVSHQFFAVLVFAQSPFMFSA
jgi:hypothetical protein